MRRTKWIILCCCVIAFIAFPLFTGGGLAITNSHDFNGQRNIHLADGLQSDVWLAPRSTRVNIPLLCHYYSSSGPYGLRIQIWDTSRSYSAIEIMKTVLEYEDSEVVSSTEIWTRKLRPFTQYNSSSSGIIETEMMMLSDTIDDLVVRHMDVTVTIKGRLLKSDGQEIPFSATESFEAEDRFDVKPLWEAIADI